jgi:hypothetical protein
MFGEPSLNRKGRWRAWSQRVCSFVTFASFSFALFAVFYLFRDAGTPRVWAASEVPIAFWAWRNEAPSEEEVEQAARRTRVHALFMRAGQIDYDGGTLRRIRAVTGRFPRALELHLVYNGTRSLLKEFEQADEAALAMAVAEAYREDAVRARQDGARVAGIQLDIDAPTRLLARYAKVLRLVRERLPQGTKLSVTGLPSWMESEALDRVLSEVDFWIPQCYGALIPDRLDQLTPISSAQAVARTVARARRLNRPFYAGLAAYGYAILYGRDGAMVEVRGDLDPARVANDPNLELVERRPFSGLSEENATGASLPVASEWRYVYRARHDGVTDGLAMRAGDALMLDVPSAGALRASARAVREEGGENLLGICVFRLPGGNDPTTLQAGEVAAALNDTETVVATDIQAQRAGLASRDDQVGGQSLRLTFVNSGTARAQMSDDALVVDLHVPAGSVRAVHAEGFGAVETLCSRTTTAAPASDQDIALPCAERRANVLRLKARAWMGGYIAQALINFKDEPPKQLAAGVTARMDDGRVWRSRQQVTVGNGEQP